MHHAYRAIRLASSIVATALCISLTACGGDRSNTTAKATAQPAAQTYTVGGSVTGLASGTSVTLANTANKDAITLSRSGSFAFATPVVEGDTYNVVVSSEPTNQTCSVANYQGTVGSANVSNLSVTCATNTATLSGTVSGLASGASVALSNTVNSDVVTVSSNGSFTFPAAIPAGSTYNVVVSAQPTNQVCTVGNYSGNMGSANVSSLSVTCNSTAFALGGTVTGLPVGQSISVLVNGSVQATNSGTGSTQNINLGTLTAGSSYSVTLSSAWSTPMSASSLDYCYVANATGTPSSDVSNIGITCNNGGGAPSTIPLSGTQNGVPYAGWYLGAPYPVTVNGRVEVYYEVMYDGSQGNPYTVTLPNGLSGGSISATSNYLETDMNTLQTLFNGGDTPAMNASGDPSTVVSGYAPNVTTLQTSGMGSITVAMPTIDQWSSVCSALSCTTTNAVPPGWYSAAGGIFWSSTLYSPGEYALAYLSGGIVSNIYSPYNSLARIVAVQVP